MKKLLFLLLYFASTVYSFSPSDIYNFSNGGASGNEGPTQDQVNTAYSGTTLDSQVTINTQGIQEWTVPQTGTYSIKVAGARGGGSYPSALFSDSVRNGFGAVIYATVSLTQGDVLKILVGQVGTNGSNEAGG
ncbi:MAG: glycine-rich protein, partial [Campylobacterales bacterium]|nr:glycine-rich protein [Campylobacterales bacterium]